MLSKAPVAARAEQKPTEEGKGSQPSSAGRNLTPEIPGRCAGYQTQLCAALHNALLLLCTSGGNDWSAVP